MKRDEFKCCACKKEYPPEVRNEAHVFFSRFVEDTNPFTLLFSDIKIYEVSKDFWRLDVCDRCIERSIRRGRLMCVWIILLGILFILADHFYFHGFWCYFIGISLAAVGLYGLMSFDADRNDAADMEAISALYKNISAKTRRQEKVVFHSRKTRSGMTRMG